MLGFRGKVRKFNFVEFDAESATGRDTFWALCAGADPEHFGGGMQFQIRLNLN